MNGERGPCEGAAARLWASNAPRWLRSPAARLADRLMDRRHALGKPEGAK
jgi:hypothetical protein